MFCLRDDKILQNLRNDLIADSKGPHTSSIHWSDFHKLDVFLGFLSRSGTLSQCRDAVFRSRHFILMVTFFCFLVC